MKKNNVFLVLSIFGVSFLSFFSCKPGLGDAIDTKAPTISISSPTDNFCVRDNFILQGTQSDDRGVTKITVSLKQVENEKIIYDDFEPKFKTVSDEKEEPWTCEINTVEKDSDGNVIKHLIKDGTYTATVTAYDSYNQKNVVTKTFVIDNTPPLVILDTPSSEKLDGADSFGQNFYLNGQVYDKNEIDFIDVSVFEYDEATSEILEEKATIKLSDIGTSLESETVADWERETETSTGKINYYKQIYGEEEKAGNKKFYFKLNSHDKARKLLPDGSVDSSDTGNTTSDFFFNKDEISNIVKNIKPSGIYSLISESFETEGNSRNITTLDSNYLEKLKSNKKEKGTFQLNPDNTPTYVIDGINSFNSLGLVSDEKFDFRNDKLKFVLSGTSSITVTFSKGLDKTALMPETFGVELIKADETGSIAGGGNLKKYELLKPIYDFTDKENWGKKDYDITKLTSNGDNYSATIPITLKEVEEGFYYINVYGYDQFKIYDEELNQIKGFGNKLSFAEGSDKLKNGYAYGLWIVGSDKAPSLSIYKDKDHTLALGTQNIGKGKDLTIYGIAKDESGQGRPLKISFYKDEEKVPFAVYDKDVSGKTDGKPNSDEFVYTISAAEFEKLAGELTDLGTSSFKITVSAQDKSSGLTTSKEINISYDNQAPVIESIDILPNVEVENAEENAPVTVNGKITVKPTVSDASSVTISYRFGEENSEEYKTENIVQSGKTSFEIDTTKFEDKKEKKLTIFAKDIAGNISSETVTLFVNQETDAPTIEFTNGNKEIKDVEVIKQNEENIFGKSNNKIQFVIKDDDGFEQNGITLSVQKLKYENGTYVADGEPKNQKQPTKETTSVNLNYSLPDEVSAYKITIIAKDKKSETKFSSTEIKDIFVVYDNENPSLKINNYKIGENSEKSYEKVAYSKSSQKITIKGSASDDSNLPVEVKRYDSSDIEDGIPKEKAIGKSMTITDGTWTDEIPSEDVKSNKTYIYIATDMYGKTTNTDFVLKIDDIKPQLKDLEIDGSSYDEENYKNRWFKSTAIQFKGKVEDAASGIEVLNYQIENADGTKTDASSSITVNNDGSFSTTLNSFKESNGEKHNTIIFTVKDNAGNEFTRSYEIKIDTVPPTVNDKIEYYFGAEVKKSLESVILSNGEKSITITGTCSDSASGLARAELIIGEKTYDCSIDASGNWTSTITEENLSKMAENSTAKVRVYDNAGNSTDSKTITIKIDKTAPEVSITSPTENATLNETIKIEGTVTEDNTPLSIEIYSYAGSSVPQTLDGLTLLKKITTQQRPEAESADEKYIYGASVSDIYSWKFEQNVNELLLTEMKNDLYLLVVAYDEAGNCNVDTKNIKESDCKKYVIDKDSDRPIIKISTLTSASGNIIKNNSTINGSIEDDDGAVSVLKISPEPITDWVLYTQPEGTLSYSSGSFTYTPKDNSDGEKEMYFYIKDSAGKEFYTKTAEELSRPYVSFKTETGYSEKEDNNKGISFILDSSPAEVGKPKYAVSSETFEYKTDLKFTEMGTKNLVGGKNKYIIFGVEATDDNGIESVEFSFAGGNDSFKIDSQTVKIPVSEKFYATSAIDLSKNTSGIITLTILVKDKSGFETTVQKQFTIDNDPPEVEIQNPATSDKLSTEELTGSVTLSGTAFDSLSTIEEIKYLILDDSYFYDAEIVNIDEVYKKLRDSEYTCENKGTTAGWKFNLEDLPSGSFTEKDGKLISDLSNYSKLETSSEGTKTLYHIPVYIYAKDSLGNEKIDFIKLKYNPYGDRPSVEISETSPGMGENKNTNGSIQINGSAEDNVSVKGVYIQIDANKDGIFDDNDVEILKNLKNGSEQIYTIIDEDSIAAESDGKTPNYDAIKYTETGTETGENFWGIKVNGTNSWNITINKAREFQNDDTTTGEGTYQLSYRIIAVDNNYKFGSWTEKNTFTIDTNVPEISSEGTIVGYSDESRTEQTSSRKYTSDMYLVTTNNYNELQVIVSDKSDIKKVEYYQANSLSELASVKSSTEITDKKLITSSETGYVEGKNSYLVKIPLNKLNGKDNLAIQIVATKNNIAETTAYAKYSVKFDDDAPEINYISYNGDKVSDATDASNVVENSNSVFTLGGQASDEGSGFARALFFYNRPANSKTGSKNRIYDPIAGNKTEIDLENASTKEFGSQTMYGYEPSSVEIGEDKKTITIENSTEKFIYPRGVVYINGSWFTIAKEGIEKSGDYVSKVTVESEITAAETYDVFFPYARVIDNTGTEKGGFETSSIDSSYGDTSDDGDGMPESVIKSQTQWTFDASVRSNFIPDGPGSITVFVFDNAGNCSAKKYDAKVQNNAPRLTKLWLGTDLSGNDEFEENEFTSYDVFAKTGTEQRTYEMKTADFGGTRFRILNKLALVTEFVGGNNAKNNGIKLAFNNDAFSETEKCNTAESGELISSSGFETSDIKVREDKFTASGYTNSTDSTKTLSKYAYVISKDKLGKDSTGEINNLSNRVMSFTFWDDTEDSTQGKDSGYCYLKINDLAVIQEDNFAPSVAINPFYWKSPDENSLYKNNYLNGHIDLSRTKDSTLDKKLGLFVKDGKPVLSEKPKVSGKISITGSAIDEHSLASIWASFDGFTPSNGVDGGSETSKTIGEKTYYCVAEYDDDTKNWKTVTTENVSGTNWNFQILETSADQNGNLVTWQLDLDTSAIEGAMGNGKKLSIVVYDAAGTPHHSSLTATPKAELTENTNTYDVNKYNVPSYTMDVVPYISGIENANRSRLGKYPVRKGENVVITGFNFGNNPSVYRKKTGETGNGEAVNVNKSDSTSITITAPEYSGYIYASWDVDGKTITTLNNENSNEVGYNIEEGYVSKDSDNGQKAANEAGTNFWTDDRYLSVWNVGTTFVGSINPHSGAIKKIDKYNSGSGAGFWSESGWTAAPAPGDGQLYKQDGYSSAVDPVKDMNDSYYAAISSDDLKLYGYVSGKEYSAHGDNIAFNSSEVAYVAPVDEMDYTIVNGVPYYVMQDNGLGGASGSVWGLGLCMMREGIWYDRTYFNPYGGNTIEEAKLPFFVERQGYNVASHKRDSSTGYDSILYQFKNPRIAGWYNEKDSLLYTKVNGNKSVRGVDYIYISYYDSYAKCLKYAAYRIGHRFASNDGKYANSALKDWGKIDVDDNIDIVAEMTSSPNTVGNQPEQKTFNHMTDGASVVAGNETTSNNPTYTEIAGEWSDIFVDSTTTSDPRPVIIYYNKTKKCLEVAYGKNSFPQKTDEWTKSTIKPTGVKSDFGRYVSAAMDSKGNLHVAAQDADKAKLYYLYLEKSESTYSVKNSVAVDSSNGAGRWTDIELTNPEGTTLAEIKPVISYIDTSYLGTQSGIKVAWLESVSDDKLNFEAMTDPANYASSDQRTSVMAHVKETKSKTVYSPVAVGFNSDMFAVDFLRGEE